MKANRKFLAREDNAVSPVIAVILMVAITVVLAATVYVWVSGFGQSGSQAKSLSVSQTACTAGDTGNAKFTVVSVSPNFAGNALSVKDATTGETLSTGLGATAIAAGDTITATGIAGGNVFACTDTLNFVDTASNTVVATITLHT